MPEESKQFKILRTHKQVTTASALTNRLKTLTLHMERLQAQYPDDEFQIVDSNGNPAQINDYIAADLASPANKAKRKKARQKEELKAEIQKRLKQCS